jgi:hypothetical protein
VSYPDEDLAVSSSAQLPFEAHLRLKNAEKHRGWNVLGEASLIPLELLIIPLYLVLMVSYSMYCGISDNEKACEE